VQDSAFVTPQYSSVYDDVFMNKKETKWLFKINLLATDFRAIIQGIIFEHKINKNLSFSYSMGLVSNFESPDNRDFERKKIIGIQPRWYFKNNKMVNNLNGNYVGLSAFYSLGENLRNNIENRPNWALAATYGIQRRVFNSWYIDWQLGVGMDKLSFKNESEFQANQIDYWLHNQFTLGLAFGGGKKSATNKCNLFSCFEEEKSLWKLEMRNIYKSYSSGGGYSIEFNPEYERKIGKSSFSINTGLGISYGDYYYRDNFYGGYNLGVNATIEPRYYYNLKKRIATGKSANNLSGNYFSINVNGSFSKSYYGTLDSAAVIKNNELSGNLLVIEPRWGIQRRLFKNGFLDLSVSPFYFRKSVITFNDVKIDGSIANRTPFGPIQEGFQYHKVKNSEIPFPKIYFKIGFAF
jgi:hypothetical protein